MSDDDNEFEELWETFLVIGSVMFHDLPKSEPGPYDPVAEARKLLEAVELLEGTVEKFRESEERQRAAEALAFLREEMEGAVRGAKEAVEMMESHGLRLDPDDLGGATLSQNKRGPDPSFTRLRVKKLLSERHPEWDGIEPYPGPNDQELRDWLRERLLESPPQTPPWIQERIAELGEELFDPRSRGPLWRIVDNLKNP